MKTTFWQRKNFKHLILVALTTLVVVLSFTSPSLAEPQITVEISRISDATNIKFKGASQWKYLLRKEKDNHLVLRLPALTVETIAALQTHSDPLIKSIQVNRDGIDGTNEVTFELSSGTVDSFDYLTDQPSQLVVDFFTKKAKTADADDEDDEDEDSSVIVHQLPPPAKAPSALPLKKVPADKIAKKTGTNEENRKPSGDFFRIDGPKSEALASDEKDVMHGIFDGGDPEFRRFSVQDFEIKEESLIASRGNLYIQFPMLQLDSPHLKALLGAPPTYEIVPQNGQENNEARLLLTLFKNQRRAVFLKTAKLFLKQYPETKYDEIIRYMMADTYYNLYLTDETAGDLETAMGLYRHLSEKYPDSPLATRTLLLMGYTYLDLKDSFSALKTFQRFLRLKPDSKFRDQAKISMAEAYLNLNKYDDSLAPLDDVEKNARNKKDAHEAAYRRGDVFFKRRDFAGAIENYKLALKKYPEAGKDFANAYYNMAEAQFSGDHYKEALESYREYLQKFPDHSHGGYAMTRIGEILEILGADPTRVVGAYKESYFRYRETPGAAIAHIRMLTSRMPDMKDKEIKSTLNEIAEMTEDMELPEIHEFVTLLIADGFERRGNHEVATKELINFYQHNPHLANKEKFQSRIAGAITANIRTNVEKGNFIEALRLNSQYADSWLKNSNRIDTRYYVGRAYEQAGVSTEAGDIYRDTLNKLYAIKGTPRERERKIIELLPKPDQLNLRLAAVAAHEKDYLKAAEYLKNIKTPKELTEPEQIERAEISADVAEERGQPEMAKKYLSELIDTWKGQPALVTGLQLRLARLQSETKNYKEAETSVTKIINMQKDTDLVPEDVHASALELKGDLLLERGKTNQAVRAYEDLLSAYEGKRPLSAVRYKVGKIYFEKGDLKDAESVWSALKPDKGDVWKKLADEQMQSAKWQNDYKKYINRIPAMSEMR